MSKEKLIPRKILFGYPEKHSVQISPDGKYISYIAPNHDLLNIFIAPTDDTIKARLATNSHIHEGAISYGWTHISGHIWYIGGNHALYIANINNYFELDCSYMLHDYFMANDIAFKEIAIQVSKVSPLRPHDIILKIYRGFQKIDFYSLSVPNNEIYHLYTSDVFADIYIDDNYNFRFAQHVDQNGNLIIKKFNQDLTLHAFMTIPTRDYHATYVAGLNEKLNSIYMFDSRDRDTSALFEINLDTMASTLLCTTNSKADLDSIELHAIDKFKIQHAYHV